MKKTETTIQTTSINNDTDSMNPPTTANFTDVAFAKEADKRNKTVRNELKKINSSFEKIAFNIHWFFANSAYEQLGYKNIYELAAKEYGIARGTTNNFINIVERFADRDADGNIIEQIRPELRGFQSSKLIVLLGVEDEELNNFTDDMSVREIKAKVKEINESESSDTETDNSTGEEEQDVIDTTATEVNRQVIISFSNLEEYNSYLDSMNDLIEKNLKSKSFKNGDKKIEIAITW